MCIIIDANCASEFAKPTEDAQPIIDWIIDEGGKLASGGELKTELIRSSIRPLYREWVLAGRIYEYSDEEINAAREDVVTIGHKSNDIHIIALARVSNCRLVFSRDQDLHTDFKDLNLLPTPKGKIYQCQNHRDLLPKANQCREP